MDAEVPLLRLEISPDRSIPWVFWSQPLCGNDPLRRVLFTGGAGCVVCPWVWAGSCPDSLRLGCGGFPKAAALGPWGGRPLCRLSPMSLPLQHPLLHWLRTYCLSRAPSLQQLLVAEGHSHPLFHLSRPSLALSQGHKASEEEPQPHRKEGVPTPLESYEHAWAWGTTGWWWWWQRLQFPVCPWKEEVVT